MFYDMRGIIVAMAFCFWLPCLLHVYKGKSKIFNRGNSRSGMVYQLFFFLKLFHTFFVITKKYSFPPLKFRYAISTKIDYFLKLKFRFNWSNILSLYFFKSKNLLFGGNQSYFFKALVLPMHALATRTAHENPPRKPKTLL